MLGLPADTTDLVLYGLEQALPVDEIAAQLLLDSVKVRELKELVGFSEHMRNPSMSLMDR